MVKVSKVEITKSWWNMERIVLFDGICNLCNHSVQFIIKRDPQGHFKFASLQSEIGQKLLAQYQFDDKMDSFVLIENEKAFIKSTAALRVCMRLNGYWRLLAIFRVIPPFIRDYFYNLVARNRYKWFGEKESCLLPTPEIKKRFLG